MASFRFERNRSVMGVSLGIKLEEFKEVVGTVNRIIQEHRKKTAGLVFVTAEKEVYYWERLFYNPQEGHKLNVGHEEPLSKLLERRKPYVLGDVTEEVWRQAYRAQAVFATHQRFPPDDPFLMIITYDHAQQNTLSFFGEGIDDVIAEEVLKKYHHRDLTHRMHDYNRKKEIEE